MSNKTISGLRIRELRKRLHLSNAEFGERIHVTAPYISMIETGRREPSVALLRSIAYEFKVPFEWLLGVNTEEEAKNLDRLLHRNPTITEADIKLIHSYINMPPEDRIAIQKFIKIAGMALSEVEDPLTEIINENLRDKTEST